MSNLNLKNPTGVSEESKEFTKFTKFTEFTESKESRKTTQPKQVQIFPKRNPNYYTGDKSEELLTSIALIQSTSDISCVDHNQYGKKDNIGFQAVSQDFCDNVLVAVPVTREELVRKDKNGKSIPMDKDWIGEVPKDILDANGNIIQKKSPKIGAYITAKCGVHNQNLQRKFRKRGDESRDISAIKLRYNPKDDTFVQVYKVSMHEAELETVLEIISSDIFGKDGTRLEDIDFTRDLSGSFDQQELSNYLVDSKICRLKSKTKDWNSYKDIILDDNDALVGSNCLTIVSEDSRFRYKYYNKQVQMLESKSVRTKYGQHWHNWIYQTGTRLSEARDKATNRGLTRLELTMYFGFEDLNVKFIKKCLDSYQSQIPKHLVYSTPYSCVWKGVLDKTKQNMVLVDNRTLPNGEKRNNAMVVYSVNKKTGKVQSVNISKNWSRNRNWVLAHTLLSNENPIEEYILETYDPVGEQSDAVEATQERRQGAKAWETHGRLEPMYSLTKKVFIRTRKTGLDSWKTVLSTYISLVGTCTKYIDKKNITQEDLEKKWENAGVGKHPNLQPTLYRQKEITTNGTNLDLYEMECLVPMLPMCSNDIDPDIVKKLISQRDEYISQQNQIVQTKLLERKEIQSRLLLVRSVVEIFRNSTQIGLKNIPFGIYKIIGYKLHWNKRWGKEDIVVYMESRPKGGTSEHGKKHIVFGNWELHKALTGIEIITPTEGVYCLVGEETIATMDIYGRNGNGRILFHIQIGESLDFHTREAVMDKEVEIEKSLKEEIPTTIPVDLPLEETLEGSLPVYKSCLGLEELPPNSIHLLKSFGWTIHYKQSKLLVQIGEIFYQAGSHLESLYDGKWMDGTIILLCKCKTDRKNRKHYMECVVVGKGEWWKATNISKTEKLVSEENVVEVQLHKGKYLCRLEDGSIRKTTIPLGKKIGKRIKLERRL